MSDSYLIKGWGETEYPTIEIVVGVEQVRDAVLRQIYSNPDDDDRLNNAEMLDQLMDDLEESNKATAEFEIGGLSVELVNDLSAPLTLNDAEHLLAKARLDGLRELCGAVENGSDTTVTLFQDDATRDWMLRVGKGHAEYASSFGAVIDKAVAKHKAEEAAEEARAKLPKLDHRVDPATGKLKHCVSGRDGECNHHLCPQLADGEPVKSGRHCPLDNRDED